jgi:ankyrin repeat protein
MIATTTSHARTPRSWRRATRFVCTAILALLGVSIASSELLEIARFGTTTDIASLLDVGASTQQTDNEGRTPLHHASAWNTVEVVQLLLRNDASINTQDASGYTPLHDAIRINRDPNVAITLLEAGADPNARNTHGSTPLHFAIERRHPGAEEVVAALIQAGANVDAQDELGYTPLLDVLYLPSLDGHLVQRIAEQLLSAGADVDAAANDGTTALMLAAAGADTLVPRSVLLRLLDARADPTALDQHGMTAMDYAAKNINLAGSGLYLELQRATQDAFERPPGD